MSRPRLAGGAVRDRWRRTTTSRAVAEPRMRAVLLAPYRSAPEKHPAIMDESVRRERLRASLMRRA